MLSPAPIRAIYSSPSTRAIETIAPLADRLGLTVELVPDLRERELPVVPLTDFDDQIRECWDHPKRAIPSGESNAAAQARATATLRALLARHAGEHVVLATHGNLLTLTLHALDPAVGYEFWRALSFPDVYRLTFDGGALVAIARKWQPSR